MKPFLRLPIKGLWSARSLGLAALAVLLGAVGLAALNVARDTGRLVDLERLRSELRHSRQENQVLRQALQRVGDRVSSLELLAEEVQILSRITARRGRNGVPSRVYFSQLTFSEAGGGQSPPRSRAFGSLLQNVDRQIDDLAQLYRQGYFRLSYTPSTWPVKGILRDRFGYIRDRFGPGRSQFHRGIDISTGAGSVVMASADGTVLSARRHSNYGKTVILRHRFGISTVYAHLSAYNVKPGEPVRRGQVIGLVGNTGRSTAPHLHYEVRVGDMPVNPMRYLSNQARVTLPKLKRVSIAR